MVKQLIKKNIIRILVSLFIVVICALIWRTELKNAHSGYQEVYVAASEGGGDFTASFDTVDHIVLCAENAGYGTEDISGINITVAISEAGSSDILYTLDANNLSVHVNGYTSIDGTYFSGLPINLTPGTSYHLAYFVTGVPEEAQDMTLSFMLYGPKQSTNRASALFIAAVIVILLVVVWSRRSSYRSVVILWAAAMAMTLFVMPAVMSDNAAERQGFAQSYARSGYLLGKETTNEDGYAYIEEDGIRNMGYVSYAVPILRFWSDDSYGNNLSTGAVSALFDADGVSLNLLQIPATLGIGICRLLGASFKNIMVTGWIINAVISAVILAIALRISKDNEFGKLIQLLMFWPGMSILLYSYTTRGIVFALLILIMSIVRTKVQNDTYMLRTIPCCVATILAMFIAVTGPSLGNAGVYIAFYLPAFIGVFGLYRIIRYGKISENKSDYHLLLMASAVFNLWVWGYHCMNI